MIALLGSAWAPWLLKLLAIAAAILLLLNAPLYKFFLAKRGLWFTIRAVPWHWAYFTYATGTFILASIYFRSRAVLSQKLSSAPRAETA